MRASTHDDNVEATAVVEATTIAATTTNSDTVATTVPPVLTASAVTAAVPAVLTVPAASAAPAVLTVPAASAAVPEVFIAAPASTADVPEVFTAPASSADVPVVLTATIALTAVVLQQAVLPEEDHQIISSGSNNIHVNGEEGFVLCTIGGDEERSSATNNPSCNNEEPPEALMECQFSSFQYNSLSNGTDEEQALESFIKQLAQFEQVQSIDINYQGETIHAMFNEKATHIGLIGKGTDLSSFHDRKGKVFYITDLSSTHSSGEVMIAVAWKLNSKDTFGLLQTISFEQYIYCLENR